MTKKEEKNFYFCTSLKIKQLYIIVGYGGGYGNYGGNLTVISLMPLIHILWLFSFSGYGGGYGNYYRPYYGTWLSFCNKSGFY